MIREDIRLEAKKRASNCIEYACGRRFGEPDFITNQFVEFAEKMVNPWHRISEENKLPKEDTFMVSYPAKFCPEFCYYEKHLDKWVVNNLVFTFKTFKKMYTHWMEIPKITED